MAATLPTFEVASCGCVIRRKGRSRTHVALCQGHGTGIIVRHSRSCPRHADSSLSPDACTCAPSLNAYVWHAGQGKRIYETFGNDVTAAQRWRAMSQSAVAKGTLHPKPTLTIRDAAEEWIDLARSGAITNRSGEPFKPSVVYDYERSLRTRIIPDLGALKLSDVRRPHLKRYAEKLLREGGIDEDGKPTALDPSRVRNILAPLRAVFNRHVELETIPASPFVGLRLPMPKGKRKAAITNVADAPALIGALGDKDRALWGVMLYGGLRLGEVRALDWSDLNLAASTIEVRRSHADKPGATVTGPKSKRGERTVDILFGELHDLLTEHAAITGRREGLVFGVEQSDGSVTPFTPTAVRNRAETAWKNAGMPYASPHRWRHTFGSLLLDAGVPITVVSRYLGHASIAITADIYGHQMDGAADAHRALVAQYVAANRVRVSGEAPDLDAELSEVAVEDD